MKKPFYKLKIFYIPCSVLIVWIIFTSLAYHFLQRPLELIFWDRYYQKKEKELFVENLYETWEDEKEFKKYYNDFYLKTNQEERHNNLHKKLLIYNQNTKNDFLHMSLLGLDKIYLQALVDKNKIYFTNLSWEFALRIFDNKFLS